MAAWRMGRLHWRSRHEGVPIKIALSALRSPRIEHVRGTAVYMMEDPALAPRSFLHTTSSTTSAPTSRSSSCRRCRPPRSRGWRPTSASPSRSSAGDSLVRCASASWRRRTCRRPSVSRRGRSRRQEGPELLRQPRPSGRGRGRLLDVAARPLHLLYREIRPTRRSTTRSRPARRRPRRPDHHPEDPIDGRNSPGRETEPFFRSLCRERDHSKAQPGFTPSFLRIIASGRSR